MNIYYKLQTQSQDNNINPLYWGMLGMELLNKYVAITNCVIFLLDFLRKKLIVSPPPNRKIII